jgi:hypothetical protein
MQKKKFRQEYSARSNVFSSTANERQAGTDQGLQDVSVMATPSLHLPTGTEPRFRSNAVPGITMGQVIA